MEEARISPSHHPPDVLPPVHALLKFIFIHAVILRRASEHGGHTPLRHGKGTRQATRGMRSAFFRAKIVKAEAEGSVK